MEIKKQDVKRHGAWHNSTVKKEGLSGQRILITRENSLYSMKLRNTAMPRESLADPILFEYLSPEASNKPFILRPILFILGDPYDTFFSHFLQRFPMVADKRNMSMSHSGRFGRFP